LTKELLYATTNPGKMMEVRKIFEPYGLSLLSPLDIGLSLDVPETGTTLEENATLKAQAYMDQANGRDLVILADDTGVEIDALNGEPGIFVRRWIGRKMTDEEIIDLCLTRMQNIPAGQRGAQFRTALAVGLPGTGITLFEGTLRGEISEQADPLRIEGFPFESVFFVPEWDLLLGKVYDLPAAEKAHTLTHRERAVRSAIPYIQGLLNG
jgi:XTP/dITP diphosphohydrolase